jgi:hypothetical protein
MFVQLLVHPAKAISPLERSIGFDPSIENQIFRNEMSETTMTVRCEKRTYVCASAVNPRACVRACCVRACISLPASANGDHRLQSDLNTFIASKKDMYKKQLVA